MGVPSFLSTGQGQFPSVVTNTARDPKSPTFSAHLLGDNDQKCDQILGIQHKVFFVHNIAQCPSEEVFPESTGDKGTVISRKTHGGSRDQGTPAPHRAWDRRDRRGGQGVGKACSVPWGGAGAWGSL